MITELLIGGGAYAVTDSPEVSVIAALVAWFIRRLIGGDDEDQQANNPAKPPRLRGKPSAASLAALKAKR